MRPLRLDLVGTSFVLVCSGGYIAGSIATRVMAPLAVTLWRFAIAVVVLGVVAAVRREQWPRGREAVALLGVGVPLFAVQFGGFYSAMADGLSAGTTSLIACSAPLVIALIGAASGWERLRPVQGFGIGLGVFGVLVTLSDQVSRPPNLASLLWALLGLAGVAVGTTLHSRIAPDRGPTAIAAVEIAGGVAVLAVWAPLQGASTIPLNPAGLIPLGLALVPGIGAPLLLFTLVRRRGATRASSHLFVVPAVTALAAWPLLGPPLGPLTVVGLAIVLVALQLTTSAVQAEPEHAAARAVRPFHDVVADGSSRARAC